jgi:hypothetical protein
VLDGVRDGHPVGEPLASMGSIDGIQMCMHTCA